MSQCNPAHLMEQPRQFREHYYETEDAMEAVAQPGYFAPAAHMLAVGDLLRVRAALPDDIVYDEFLVTHVNVARGAVTLQPRTHAPSVSSPQTAARVAPGNKAFPGRTARKPAARKGG